MFHIAMERSIRSMDGTFSMDNEHLCGGMVKDTCLEELNAPPFCVSWAMPTTLGIVKNCKNWKIVE